MIIAAFPGSGKTSFEIMCRKSGLKVIDLESNKFDLKKIDIYIDAIEKATKEYEIVMVASLINVIKKLVERKLKFTLVYPVPSMKSEFMLRYLARQNTKPFIDRLNTNWDRTISRLNAYSNPLVTKFKLDSKHPYLTSLPGLIQKAKLSKKTRD